MTGGLPDPGCGSPIPVGPWPVRSELGLGVHATLVDFLVELAHNAIEAGSTAVVADVVERKGRIEVCVSDDGPGMDEAAARRAVDPFHTAPGKHPGRRAGLGLPFLEQAVRQVGGEFELSSEPGQGTSVRFEMDLAHVDTPPAGDWAAAAASLFARAAASGAALRFHRELNGRRYAVASDELSEATGPLTDAGALALAGLFLKNQEAALTEAAADETVEPIAAGTAGMAGVSRGRTDR